MVDLKQRRRFLKLAVAGAAGIVAASPSTTYGKPAGTKQAVRAVEDARSAALIRSDLTALDRIMADEITYVHASGKVDTKTSFLSAIRTGQLHYIAWQPIGLQVRVFEDAALVQGRYAVKVLDSRMQPEPFEIGILFLSVYAWRDGRWQQVAWQSTRDGAMPHSN
jgi:hypothetical protein